ncbi:HupE/UreJ family protein [Ramlibacter sp. G-1-2-2]|uniref:HupE/UreJ family protein n=1 Tax=Ramlibacter agri TaxID=2728837 RepID=A0A848H203_9BURK|nr:HupE/UreJ family protein [Ramlibacter agri]NML43539.1 HupE/UreJ family protein [Ramlibacter agri]
MKTRTFWLAAAALLATAAQAHNGDTPHTHAGFLAGFVHPLTGFDHLAAMVAVGLWSALAVRPVWLAPAAFVGTLLAGALAGFAGLQVPAVEPMIAASLLALGLLVATQRRLPLAAAAALAGGFAFFHGAAHGFELAEGGGAALAGMVLATALLHATGIALGRLVLARHRWLPVVSGSGVALLGATLLARLA